MIRGRFLTLMLVLASFLIVPAVAQPEVARAVDSVPYAGQVTRTDGVDGTVTSQSNPKVLARVWDMVEIDGTMYVAGKFTQVVRATTDWSKVDQPFLAAFDVHTGSWVESFRPVLNGPVWALEKGDGVLYIGGEFTTVNGQAHAGLAGIDPKTGAISSTFNSAVERPNTTELATVRDVKLTGGYLYITGNFSRATGGGKRVTVAKAARFNPSTGVPDAKWLPQLAGRSGWGIDTSTDGTRVYLGGEFSYVNGAAGTATFAAVDAVTGALIPGFKNGFDAPTSAAWANGGIVFDLAVYKDKVYVAGAEHFWEIRSATDGSQVKLMMNLDTPSFVNKSWYGFNDTQVVEILDGVVYIGCHCYNYRHWGEFAIDAETGNIIGHPTQDVQAGDAGWAYAMDSEKCLWAGGDFRSSQKVVGLPEDGTWYWVGNFARLCPSGGAQTGADPLVAVNASWKVNTSGSWPAGWTTTSFNDSSWSSAIAPTAMGESKKISAIEIWNRTDCCADRLSSFYVMTSNTPFGTRTLAQLLADSTITKTKISQIPSPSITVPVNTTARYVRIQNTAASGYMGLAEVKVLDDTGANITRGDYASQSSTGWSAPAERAIDGITNGVFSARSVSHTLLEANPWWQVDLSGRASYLESTTNPTSVLARTTFTVTDPTKYKAIAIALSSDDGATVWINGKPVVARNMPNGTIDATTLATTDVTGTAMTKSALYYVPASAVVAGQNTIAVSLHKAAATSADLGFGLTAQGWTTSPDAFSPTPLINLVGAPSALPTPYTTTARYLASDAPSGWTATGFDASSWPTLTGVLGLDDPQATTTPIPADRTTYYARYSFTVPAADVGKSATISVLRDDGVVLYLNGTEVGRDNMPVGALTPTTLASGYITGAGEVTPVTIQIPAGQLVAGTNVIAAEVHQAKDSKDLVLGVRVEKNP